MAKNLENKEVFSKNLRYYMSNYGINRKELSERLKIPYMTLSDWYNAVTYPRIDKIEMLADFFNINKSDLIEDKKDNIPDTFNTPEEAMDFLLNQAVIMGFNGLDISKLSEEEQLNYANEVLEMMKLVSLKYKDKLWNG